MSSAALEMSSSCSQWQQPPLDHFHTEDKVGNWWLCAKICSILYNTRFSCAAHANNLGTVPDSNSKCDQQIWTLSLASGIAASKWLLVRSKCFTGGAGTVWMSHGYAGYRPLCSNSCNLPPCSLSASLFWISQVSIPFIQHHWATPLVTVLNIALFLIIIPSQ